jgi:hypothetical protein
VTMSRNPARRISCDSYGHRGAKSHVKNFGTVPYVKHRAENDLFCTVADEPPDPT